jgi:hypothetical protein
MTSADFRTFVDTLAAAHQTWLSGPAPSGDQWFDHYVGDPMHPDGLLRRYEAWRAEHGYTRVRPWNGTEALGRTGPPEIPSPGRVMPWLSGASAGPPFSDANLADGTTSADLQTHFVITNALGIAIRTHWNSVKAFSSGGEIDDDAYAIYSIRFWGFMKWASVMRNRFLGIPVFNIPIEYDADGVPISDIEYMDIANRWHGLWHVGAPCGTNTPGLSSSMGQFCGRFGTAKEFLLFHRDILNTYDNWRRRAGMPPVTRWKPAGVHFDHVGPDVSDDPATQEAEIAEYGKRFNTLDGMAAHQEGALHGSGHSSTASPEIGDVNTNNYSPRFFAWHRWMDYLWEKRQPRFTSFRPVGSDGTDYPGVLTVVRPAAGADQIQPNNAVSGVDAQGRGTMFIKYNVKPETYGRPINLTITAEVFRNSSDTAPVAALAATSIPVNPVAQGADSAAVAIQFTGLDAGEGAFARENLVGGGIGFKNGRIRITGHLAPVGNVPGSTATDAPNDQFDHTQHIDIILVKENRPPVVSTLLNKSSFSYDEVILSDNGAGQSAFANAFLVVLQDTPEPPTGFASASILPQNADPAHTTVSGIFGDDSVEPIVQVVDQAGTNPVNWFSVFKTDSFKEQPSLHDNVSQRVLYRYLVIVNVAAINGILPAPGAAPQFARLRITARDRSGNTVQNVLSPPIKFFREANPYMIDVRDEIPAWLSIDTRVFSVKQGDLKFNHSVAGSGNPNQYISDVIDEFNAGTQNFDTVPGDQGQSSLELAPQVSGTPVHNFALARLRMKTQVAVPNVRVFFRLFTTALSNLSFNGVNYPTGGAAPIALLGRTSPSVEIVSIPFFAAARRDTAGTESMADQTDPKNVQQFDISPAGQETIRYFGAYLDINSDTTRFPQAPSGDGPFPAAQCVSIRNILRGQHQCMVAEIFYAGDPTEPNENPFTSDNLAQRNLLIIETDNPGTEATHTVQHSFDVVLPNKREAVLINENLRQQQVVDRQLRQRNNQADVSFLTSGFNPNMLTTFTREAELGAAVVKEPAISSRIQTGFDELVFFWNNLPRESRVEVHLPSLDVGYITLLRLLRSAPQTVRILDDNTLLLTPEGVTYLPIPPLAGERIAGLITVVLPDTIRTGQLFKVDILQVRAVTGMVIGAFQLMIPVSKASLIYAREARILEVFEERLRLTSNDNRWHPILVKQVNYLRDRAKALVEETAGETSEEGKGRNVRVVLERIQILDDQDPWLKGAGEFRFKARITSRDRGLLNEVMFPSKAHYSISDKPGKNTVELDLILFEGFVQQQMAIEIFGVELDTFDKDDQLCPYRRVFTGNAGDWLGSFGPGNEDIDLEDLGDWKLWYRIEET